jgi:hypothetical protein
MRPQGFVHGDAVRTRRTRTIWNAHENFMTGILQSAPGFVKTWRKDAVVVSH